MSQCHVCEAAEFADEESLRSLVRYQAVMLERARERLDTFALARAKARVQELEETLQRTNQSAPSRAAVEVCRQLAAMDPRTNDETMGCFFCFEKGTHRPECFWQAAVQIAKATDRRKAG